MIGALSSEFFSTHRLILAYATVDSLSTVAAAADDGQLSSLTARFGSLQPIAIIGRRLPNDVITRNQADDEALVLSKGGL